MRIILTTLLLALTFAVTPPASAATVDVSIRNQAYEPRVLRIKVGDTVVWTNNDDRDHSVAATDGSFKSGNISPGGTYQYTFRRAGTYAYGCGIHPRMRGYQIVVEP